MTITPCTCGHFEKKSLTKADDFWHGHSAILMVVRILFCLFVYNRGDTYYSIMAGYVKTHEGNQIVSTSVKNDNKVKIFTNIIYLIQKVVYI